MSSVENNQDDLEEGEIKDDAFEDISECSLSEALVMQEDLQDDPDLDLLKEEALKSLYENEEVTEAELYRLEALKSLLTNIESGEETSPIIRETRRKKRKRKKKIRRRKVSKYCDDEHTGEYSKSLAQSTDEQIGCLQTDSTLSSKMMDLSNKENQIDRNVKLMARSWYPKTDFALLSDASKVSNETQHQPTKKRWGSDDFIIVPRILVANNEIKSSIDDGVVPQTKPVISLPAKLNVSRRLAPINKLNCATTPLASHLSRYKKISKHHIQKYPVVSQPTNRFALRNVRKGKYKIVNKSCYSLKKSTSSPPLTRNDRSNAHRESVYSINRIKSRTTEPASLKQSSLIIEFDEDESDKEDGNGMTVSEQNLQQRILPPSSQTDNLDELAYRQCPADNFNFISSHTSEVGSVVESTADVCSLIIENKSNIENNETMSFTGGALNEVPIDYLKKDEALPHFEVTSSSTSATSCCDDELPLVPQSVSDVSPRVYTDQIDLFDQTTKPIATSDAIQEYDEHFPTHADSHAVSEQSSIGESQLEEYVTHAVIDDIKPEIIENMKMDESIDVDEADVTAMDDTENLKLLADAETDLIETRVRLLLNLDKFEESMKQDESEKEKMNIMLKKLLVLKSTIFKFEDKIRGHQSKLSVHADKMQALFKDIAVRTEECTQIKDVCFRVGTEIMGSSYKPPDLYESVIEEKINTIDFSKYVPTL